MRKFFLMASIMLLLGAYVSTNAQTQSGGFFFNASTPDYTLASNEGKRTVEVEVKFNKPFEVTPNVVLSVTVIDAVRDTKVRFSVEAKAVSRDGFIIKAAVWGDTQLSSLGGNWIAHVE